MFRSRRAAQEDRTALIIGISGPDGAGKSTLAGALQKRIRDAGIPASRISVYGCVVCRRIDRRRVSSGNKLLVVAETRSRLRPSIRRVGAAARLVHGVVDGGELALRVCVARSRLRAPTLSGGRRPMAILLTDRSPLDGLVKFAPEAGSLLDRLYRRLGRAYDVILLLDAPVASLVERDRDHSAPELSAMAAEFSRFSGRLGNIRRLPTAGRSAADVAAEARAVIVSRLPSD